MISRPLLFSLLVGALPSLALAGNPFASKGSHGVGDGWRTFPGKAAGVSVKLEDQTLRIDDVAEDMVSACLEEAVPVQGRLLLTGRWRYQGVEAAQGWQGARLKLYYFDSDGKRLKGEANQPQLAFGKGSADWTVLDRTLVAPETAVEARVCAELVGTTAGSMWLDSVELTNLAGSDADGGRNVVWILVDTLRSDVLGTYGSTAGVSPNIDAFAAQGIVFEESWTQYTWTVPSTISFFTSQFARTHGWNSTFDKVAAGEYTAMGEKVPTLAQVLREQGYVTSGHYANGLLKAGIGVGRGFLTWRHGNDEEVVKRAIEDIGLWGNDGGPNFLYVHLMTPHIPLRPTGAAQAAAGVKLDTPAEGFRYYEGAVTEQMSQSEYNDLFRQVYTASVFDADRYVNQVLKALEKAGHTEDTMVILTSDHGELLGEHNVLGHGSYVYEPLTAVPLVVRAPGVKPARVSDRVGRTVDIPPTVLDWLDLEAARPKGWQGISLFEKKPGLIAVSERDYMVAFTTDGRYKIIENRDSEELLQAFDLKEDPGELTSIADQGAKPITNLQKAGDSWRAQTPVPGAEELQTRKVIEKSDKEKDEELEMLRALGYVE